MPVSAAPGAIAAVATAPAGSPTPASAAVAPGAGGSASSGPPASTAPAPPSTPPRGAPAPAGPAPDRPDRPGTAAAGSAHRPARAAAHADLEIANLLKQAEDAYRRNLKPLMQLGPAGAVLHVQPDNLRARFLAGDALIKDGEIEQGCKYLAMAKALLVARTRARGAGCPDD
jgi:hypothetical protein